jgi:CRISPR system Cascade subunit CasC
VTAPLYVDLHVLQTVPPSNLNRDDAGSPKQAVYGGARRARVSSQAWKRATRTAFAQQVPREELGTRTKRIAELVVDELRQRTGLSEEDATAVATRLLKPMKVTASKKKASETSYLLFFGRPQIVRLVDLVADRAAELAGLSEAEREAALSPLDDEVTDVLRTGHPLDVALFGRMVADLANLNVDAATQVAHALSTHAVEIEFDYFTAVDDENTRDETGAGMIGTVEFNSATLYRFATVGVHQLLENLGGDQEATLRALQLFLTCFVRSMPTGHENSFAHRTVPSLVSFAVRDDQPVNFVSAFEEPVRSSAGIAAQSAERLVREIDRVAELWGLPPRFVASSYTPPAAQDAAAFEQALGRSKAFDAAVTAVIDEVAATWDRA